MVENVRFIVSPMKKARTISEIIKARGGPVAVAQASLATPFEVGSEAVRKWKHRGIPDKHWPLFARIATADELYRINQQVRKKALND